MGPTLARMAVRACEAAGVEKTVYGVSRFSDPAVRRDLESSGICTVSCDLTDPEAVRRACPKQPTWFSWPGRKFGKQGSEPLTWLMNIVAPANVARRYPRSRIVAFSTGCVYPLVGPTTGGCTEATLPAPVGEYAWSCLGRERIFEQAALDGARVLIYRLNYAVEMRYGVLVDLAQRIAAGAPVDLGVCAANVHLAGRRQQHRPALPRNGPHLRRWRSTSREPIRSWCATSRPCSQRRWARN